MTRTLALIFMVAILCSCVALEPDKIQSNSPATPKINQIKPALLSKNVPHSADYCRPNSGVQMVDLSVRVTDEFLKEMKKIGISTVARYYSYVEPTRLQDGVVERVQRRLPNKAVNAAEVALLKKHRFSSVAVFQHNNNQESTFNRWRVRGPADARRAIEMAEDLGQPKDSTIFFGVDKDFVQSVRTSCKAYPGGSPGRCNAEVLSYFQQVKSIFDADTNGFEVGVYGSGATCEMLRKNGLVTKCWLSHSSGHTGYNDPKLGLNSDATVLRQLLDTSRKRAKGPTGTCAGVDVDFNVVWNGARDFGQFVYD